MIRMLIVPTMHFTDILFILRLAREEDTLGRKREDLIKKITNIDSLSYVVLNALYMIISFNLPNIPVG